MSSYYRGKVTLIGYAVVWVALSVGFWVLINLMVSLFNMDISSSGAETSSLWLGGIATVAFGLSNDRYKKRKEELEQLKLNSEKEVEQARLRRAVASHIIASDQEELTRGEEIKQQELKRALANHTFAHEQKKETPLSDTQPTATDNDQDEPSLSSSKNEMVEEEEIYCTNCGRKAGVNDKFCKGCGEVFTE
jgi:hypothetical protein